MGWKDINMNRRKPQLRLAVVPVREGEDIAGAVLRKAAAAAIPALHAQLPDAEECPPRIAPFAAGYLAGFARQLALKHDHDAEATHPPLHALLEELRRAAPAPLSGPLGGLSFRPRGTASPRARLGPDNAWADAGYLTGHLEALCGTQRLIAAALAGPDAEAFLTACDVAADPMQTRQPLMSLRFDAGERAVIRMGFGVPHG